MNISEEAVEAAAIVLGTTKNGDPIVTVRLDDLGDLVGTTPEYWMSQARAALEAAWIVMRPEVTTRQELHALPPGTAIRSDQLGVIQKNYEGWFVPGFNEEWPIAQIPLPVTVIYRP